MKFERRIAATMLALVLMAASLYAQGTAEKSLPTIDETITKVHVDSLGREHVLPYPLERISPSGNLSQMMLYSLCPEKMVGLSASLSESAMAFMEPFMAELPEFGTFYGKKANLNKEALILAHPQAVIDIGDIKSDMENDLDTLQNQIGIPVVFIEGFLENTAETYRMLGSYTGDEERAELLASYAEKAIATAKERRAMISDPVRVYYSSSADGLDGIPTGNFHGEVIELVGGENVIPSTFSSGGNQISMEQLLIWNPDVILLVDENAYSLVMSDAKWSGLDAVRNGRVYLVPNMPYSFIDNPPAVNRIIGIYWLGQLLYPELYSDIDIEKETKEFYSLFYRYELSDNEVEEILYRT